MDMAQSFSTFDNALKDTYGPGLKNAINNSNPVLTEVPRNTEDLVGRKAVWSVHTGRSNSTGARAELAVLPTPDRQRYIQPEQTLAYEYHTIKVSGPARHLTRSDSGAFTRALESEIKGAEKDVKFDLARQILRNKATTINSASVVGVLAQVNGAPAGLVVTFDDNGSAPPAGFSRIFFVNEKLDFVNGTTGAITKASAVVTAVTATTITLDNVTGIATDDYIFRAGNYSGGDNEIDGLLRIVDTNNYAGITASSNPEWRGLTAGSSSVGVSEVLLDEAQEKVETDGDGSTPSLWITEHTQRRKLASMLQAQKRYEGREMTLASGWKGLSVAQGTLVVDRLALANRIIGLTPSELTWFVGLDWTWDDDDGKILQKALDGSDAVEARYKAYVQLAALTRNAHIVVTVAEPTF